MKSKQFKVIRSLRSNFNCYIPGYLKSTHFHSKLLRLKLVVLEIIMEGLY
jgi:hypothetical protein